MNSEERFGVFVHVIAVRVALLAGLITLLLSVHVAASKADPPETVLVMPASLTQFNNDFLESRKAGRGTTIAKVGDSNTEFVQNLYALGCRSDLNVPLTLLLTAYFYRATTVPDSDSYCPDQHNSFTRRSAASRGGASSTLPLRKSGTLPQAVGWFTRDRLCTDDDETSVACEIRLTNARYTLIGGGTNDFNPAYGLDLADAKNRFIQLINETRNNRSIPILQTIPSMVSYGDPAYNAEYLTKVATMNQAIFDAAAEKGVPVIDIWSALQNVPYSGHRQLDGIHLSYQFQPGDTSATYLNNSGDLSPLGISTYGANARNYYVLEALNRLDKQLNIYTNPPSSMSYTSINATKTSPNSFRVTAGITGPVPPGATSTITAATSPGGTGTPKTFTATVGTNNVDFTGLSAATTYYFRAKTTFGGSPTDVIGSSEISAATEGSPQTIAPTVRLDMDADQRTINFGSSVFGPGTFYMCYLDDDGLLGVIMQLCTPPFRFDDLGEGEQHLKVVAFNQGDPDWGGEDLSWEVTKPNTIIDSGPNNSITTSRSATFVKHSTDPAADTICTLKRNGTELSSQPCASSSKSYSGLADGKYEFSTNSKDASGDWDPSPPVRTWTVDNIAPTTAIDPIPAKTNNNDPLLAFTSNEPTANFECRIWQGFAVTSFSPCMSPKPYLNLADGLWTFQVRAIDRAGNVDSATAVKQFEVDTVPPDVTITGGPANGSTTTNRTPTFTSTSTEPIMLGSMTCTLKKNGTVIFQEWCGTTKTYTSSPYNLTPGNYQFTTNAADLAGNFDPTPPSRTWTIQ
ncbi:MAG: SGNH/GDSL hydrolase family protein [Solirubrobacterales bacterium]|nr:SGNH/GDSL hydrolase family protein [Solirubrobacterales bacterium]